MPNCLRHEIDALHGLCRAAEHVLHVCGRRSDQAISVNRMAGSREKHDGRGGPVVVKKEEAVEMQGTWIFNARVHYNTFDWPSPFKQHADQMLSID